MFLYSVPKLHISDFYSHPALINEYRDGDFSLDVNLKNSRDKKAAKCKLLVQIMGNSPKAPIYVVEREIKIGGAKNKTFQFSHTFKNV